jgi:hypothetical protein
LSFCFSQRGSNGRVLVAPLAGGSDPGDNDLSLLRARSNAG